MFAGGLLVSIVALGWVAWVGRIGYLFLLGGRCLTYARISQALVWFSYGVFPHFRANAKAMKYNFIQSIIFRKEYFSSFWELL